MGAVDAEQVFNTDLEAEEAQTDKHSADNGKPKQNFLKEAPVKTLKISQVNTII